MTKQALTTIYLANITEANKLRNQADSKCLLAVGNLLGIITTPGCELELPSQLDDEFDTLQESVNSFCGAPNKETHEAADVNLSAILGFEGWSKVPKGLKSAMKDTVLVAAWHSDFDAFVDENGKSVKAPVTTKSGKTWIHKRAVPLSRQKGKDGNEQSKVTAYSFAEILSFAVASYRREKVTPDVVAAAMRVLIEVGIDEQGNVNSMSESISATARMLVPETSRVLKTWNTEHELLQTKIEEVDDSVAA